MDRLLGCPGPDGAASSARALRLVASDGEILGPRRKAAVPVKATTGLWRTIPSTAPSGASLATVSITSRRIFRRCARPATRKRCINCGSRCGACAPSSDCSSASFPRTRNWRAPRRARGSSPARSARRATGMCFARDWSGGLASFCGRSPVLRAVGRGGTASFARPGSRARDDRRADDAAVRARVARSYFAPGVARGIEGAGGEGIGAGLRRKGAKSPAQARRQKLRRRRRLAAESAAAQSPHRLKSPSRQFFESLFCPKSRPSLPASQRSRNNSPARTE